MSQTRRVTGVVNQEKHGTSYPKRCWCCHLTCGERDTATWHRSNFIPFQKSIFKLKKPQAKILCWETVLVWFFSCSCVVDCHYLSALLADAFPKYQGTGFPMFLCVPQTHRCSLVGSHDCCFRYWWELLSAVRCVCHISTLVPTCKHENRQTICSFSVKVKSEYVFFEALSARRTLFQYATREKFRKDSLAKLDQLKPS